VVLNAIVTCPKRCETFSGADGAMGSWEFLSVFCGLLSLLGYSVHISVAP
jgi:hypothetical protein